MTTDKSLNKRATLLKELGSLFERRHIPIELAKYYEVAINYIAAFQGDLDSLNAVGLPQGTYRQDWLRFYANLAIDTGTCGLYDYFMGFVENIPRLGFLPLAQCNTFQEFFNQHLDQQRPVFLQQKLVINTFYFEKRLRQLAVKIQELERAGILKWETTDKLLEDLTRAMLIIFSVAGDKISEYKLLIQTYRDTGFNRFKFYPRNRRTLMKLAKNKVKNTLKELRTCLANWLTAAEEKDFPPAAQGLCDNLHELFNKAFKTLEAANVN
jgi:hypothetical protein